MNYNDVIEKAIHKFTDELRCDDNFERKLKSYYNELKYTVIFWADMGYITYAKYTKFRLMILDWYNDMAEENGGEKV